MKKYITILLILILLSSYSFGQSKDIQLHLDKAKTNIQVGGVLLCIGGATIATKGILNTNNSISGQTNIGMDIGSGLLILLGSCCLTFGTCELIKSYDFKMVSNSNGVGLSCPIKIR